MQGVNKQNSNILYNVWEVLKPFLLYYLLNLTAFLVIGSLCRTVAELAGGGFQTYLADHTETVTGLVNGLSMVIGVLPLLPMLRRELQARKCSVSDRADEEDVLNNGERLQGSGRIRYMGFSLLLTVALAVTSSLGLNIVLTLSGLVQTSAVYQDVAQQQYSVAFGVGVILYGLTSPVIEEIVFRGLIFNRLRRFCPLAAAVILSGVLFGVYHGNLVQGVYGGCMGIMMAYLYERMNSFFIPCLFHATANLAVYVTAQNVELQGRLFTVYGGVILLGISVICVFIMEKWWKRLNK